MAKKQKRSKYYDQYMRERRRIQNYISKRKKEGFQAGFQLPAIPKNITAGSVRKLKKVTPAKIRESESRYVDYETGEIIDSSNHADLTKFHRQKKKRNREESERRREIERKEREAYERRGDFAKNSIAGFLVEADEDIAAIIKVMINEALFKGYTWNDIADAMDRIGTTLDTILHYKPEAAVQYSMKFFKELDVGSWNLETLEDFLYQESITEYEDMMV